MNTSIDQLVMLLSSDWFFLKWHLLGLNTLPEVKAALQRRCRVLVEEFLDGEVDYWMISFTPERISLTQDKFFRFAASNKLSESDIKILQNIADGNVGCEQNDVSLLMNLTLLLIRIPSEASQEPLASNIVGVIRATSMMFELDTSSMDSEWLSSNSKWDSKLRQITKDLPEYVADFAQDLMTISNKFLLFWDALLEKLDGSEKTSLIAWYRATALELVGHHIEFPLAK
jgi:hypothetical protein